jgi:RNA polymerase sigma-70 factor, ECF subfamily
MTDWKKIVDQYGELVWSTIYRLVDQDADASDCFQETFLEAIKLAKKEPVRNWPAFLRHIATARALDFLRARYRLRNRLASQIDPNVAVSATADPVREAEANEMACRLRDALAELPQQQAVVFCLSCFEHWPHNEIGELLHMTPNAVGVLLHRVRQRLQELLIPSDVGSTKLE